MIGLILNNIYLIMNGLKVNIAINLICLLILLVYPNDITLFIYIFITLIFLPSSCLNIVAVSRSSKWNHFEQYMPFNEIQIVLSRYFTYFFISIAAFGILMIVSKIQNLLFGGNFSEIVIDITGLRTMTASTMIKMYFFHSHLLSILYHPLIYFFKTDKVDIVLLTSIGISFPLVYLTKSWSAPSLVLFSIGLYIISLGISCALVNREKNNL